MRNKADLITKISLLKKEIDTCLDERNEERFYRLSFELKVCNRYLETLMSSPQISFKERLGQNRDKFSHY